MLRKIFFTIILAGYDNLNIQEKVGYISKVALTVSPIVYLTQELDIWFDSNHQFFAGLVYALICNMIVGAWFHLKFGTFSFSEFFIKNFKMWIIIIVAYPLLEFIKIIVGNYVIGDVFKILIQVTTIMYPISKIFKNLYILSDKKHPPAFIMERIYNFDKTGDLEFLVNGKKSNDQHTDENE